MLSTSRPRVMPAALIMTGALALTSCTSGDAPAAGGGGGGGGAGGVTTSGSGTGAGSGLVTVSVDSLLVEPVCVSSPVSVGTSLSKRRCPAEAMRGGCRTFARPVIAPT